VVSPAGALHALPFGAFHDGRAYLIEDNEVTLTPSAGVWAHERRPRGGSARGARAKQGGLRRARAWAACTPSARTPSVEREIDSIRRVLEGWDVAIEPQPTRASFLEAAGRVDLLHVAAHGSLREDNPAYSFIELVDGPLYVHDLALADVRASTVVLTSCSSGRGVGKMGNEWVGLVRGFLGAGASTIIGSQWPVADAPTASLMSAFYEALATQRSAARALAAAMRCQIASHAHPWHWAAFSVFGSAAEGLPEHT
jgi:CHAT domain-containing protein